ncbi:PEP-CTERM sorting domain-containing protein [Aeoliella mucimassa]|uniref:Extracellular repeat, HAF family n=1 Tax=Aeoliella mucimassa TaxID=2527972 RepID=A0A518ALF2_9BACT|nr:PEP-CTERM sorting domain-containing protein [Aeoliella mucimassa]QDU55562.1 hypothetical protein Pan181_17540 [Aeoliella mucimassa]
MIFFRNVNSDSAACIILGCCLSYLCSHAQATEFIPLGDLPGGGFGSTAISVDGLGQKVVGSSATDTSDNAFLWTEVSGIQSIAPSGSALAISEDGVVVVGMATNAGTGIQEPFMWDSANGLSLLGFPGPASPSPAAALDVSGNGEVVVGFTVFNGVQKAFSWTVGAGFVDLEPLTTETSTATSISRDGSVIAGQLGNRAFRWTATDGMAYLGDLPGGSDSSEASGMSADGAIVVGSFDSSNGSEAFRWSNETGMVGLGFLSTDSTSSFAAATTESGEAIVGQNSVGNTGEAFLWTPAHGIEPLQHVLETRFSLSNELSGWELISALDISADGRFIVGRGINTDGNREAWLVRLDQPIFVPEPRGGLMGLLVIGGYALLQFRQRGVPAIGCR